MNRNTKVGFAVVAASALLVVGGASGAVAGKLITGDQIAKNTITATNLAPNSVGKSELQAGLVSNGKNGKNGKNGEDGATGPQGPVGEKGEKGDPGQAGAPGAASTITTRDLVTAPNSSFHDLPVVLVSPSPVNGTADVPVDVLSFHLDQGTYRLDLSAQFFHFVPGADGVDYGLLTMTVDGDAAGGPLWTPDIPSDGNNAAQTFGWQHLVVPAGGADVVVKATVRGVRHAEAGAYVTVSKLR